MGFYSERIVPHLIAHTMRRADFLPYRRRLVAGAHGRVLEVGIGSGENLALYADPVREVIGLDPSLVLLAAARESADAAHVTFSALPASAERIALDNETVDTVVMSWTLCSIPDAARALGEIRRVLKPGGALHFVEHGLAPDARVRWWQNRLTPLWKRVAGGCHLNRPIMATIASSGFVVDPVQSGYMPGPRPFTYMTEGRARRD